MSHISLIEYPTRAALVAALTDIRTTPGVEQVDIVDLGRTLRVVSAGDTPITSDAEVIDEPKDPVVEEPTPETEDLIGVEPVAPPTKKKKD